MYNPQKLHPISYISGIINVIKQNFIFVIIFLIFNLKDFEFTNFYSYIYPGIVTLIFVVSFIIHIVKVYKTRYWIEEDHFILTTGVFTKQRKELNIRRIQSVDTAQGIVNQLVGGVVLLIKTPSDGIELDTVSKKQSQLIQQAIKQLQLDLADDVVYDEALQNNEAHNVDNSNTATQQLYKLNFKNLLLMGMTSGAIGIAFAAVMPIFGSVSDLLPWKALDSKIEHLTHAVLVTVIIIVSVILLISYIVGTIITIVCYFNYTLTRENNQLNISYGLFKVQNITVPTDRVQAVIENQSFLRKIFGFTAIYFVITSDMDVNLEDDNVSGKVMVLPFIKRKEAFSIIKGLVPYYEFNEARKGMPLRSFHRYFIKEFFVLLVIGIIATYFWSAWALVIVSIVLLLFIINGILNVKYAGHKVDKDELVVHNVSIFGMKNSYFKRDKILGMENTQTPFLKRSNLTTFKYVIAKAAGMQKIGLKYENTKNVNSLKQWYLRGERHE
ncbi:MAG TPA: PH domain-containing protein [Staphylococcus kloosii]|uniref:PH domain-containing protein n=1 Tax=Staphylococcus kloosii TaxID=29384 RepID=A0A921GYI2_9STAP|nr:PH domain-containing protein [Staphylococcus kloosii]HJF67479.1 PH domain-containing protein [Staphylococcus kloosii]